jgi:hypothetical protein
MANNSLSLLIDALHNHGVPYDRDVIKSVFDDADTKAIVQAWIQKHLSAETLLTRDEAAL